jgi:hypothetical protein
VPSETLCSGVDARNWPQTEEWPLRRGHSSGGMRSYTPLLVGTGYAALVTRAREARLLLSRARSCLVSVTTPLHRDPGQRPSMAIWPVTAATSRGYTTHYLVVASDEHVAPEIEYVVRREPRYWVVAKIGVGAEISRREQEPRRTWHGLFALAIKPRCLRAPPSLCRRVHRLRHGHESRSRCTHHVPPGLTCITTRKCESATRALLEQKGLDCHSRGLASGLRWETAVRKRRRRTTCSRSQGQAME